MDLKNFYLKIGKLMAYYEVSDLTRHPLKIEQPFFVPQQ